MSEPERWRCETCIMWKPTFRDLGECKSGDAWVAARVEHPTKDFGCRFWQSKEEAIDE